MMQQARQVAALLEQASVAPDRPLAGDDIHGLPLIETVWGETLPAKAADTTKGPEGS